MLDHGMNLSFPREETGWIAGYAAISRQLAFEAHETPRPASEGDAPQGRAPASCVGLNETIEKTMPALRRAAGALIVLAVDLQPGRTGIRAEAKRVEQLLLALVSVAREAMPDGGTLTLCTRTLLFAAQPGSRAVAAGRYVVLSARDTGPAMPEEARAGLSAKAELLLASVRGIVEECGGRMEIDSGEGAGTEHRIHFPAGENP